MFKVGEEVEANKVISPYAKTGAKGVIIAIDPNDPIYEFQVRFPDATLWVKEQDLTRTSTPYFTLPMGSGNTNSWEHYMPHLTSSPEKSKSKCECGQSKVIGANEIDDPQFHQKYCVVYIEWNK